MELSDVESYRDDLVSIRAAAQEAWETAAAALSGQLLSDDDAERTAAASALKSVASGIVDQYGLAAASTAESFFRETVPGVKTTALADASGIAETEGSVGYSVGRVFDDPSERSLASFVRYMDGVLGKWIFDRANQTVVACGGAYRRSTGRRLYYARVPTGAETCAFCLMLAGRGFVYDAGTVVAHVHSNCDCVCVASPSRDGIVGYDYGVYESMYYDSLAKNAYDQVNLAETLRNMRTNHGLK